MTDCDHEYELGSIESPSGKEGRGIVRTVTLRCKRCDHRQTRFTQRTDAEINAEIAALTA